ncbi:hypothetical protein DPEC_G00154920 [Dallia pectoralis]|uniref:Uncharacterized protein n=1 Tax=Dallia pectoralis TaxID=75939 RepID=A0ACC2GKJ9_DALPE|nr:hypothetical protein DPEC_G00154920 [Dallia pectoralis]
MFSLTNTKSIICLSGGVILSSPCAVPLLPRLSGLWEGPSCHGQAKEQGIVEGGSGGGGGAVRCIKEAAALLRGVIDLSGDAAPPPAAPPDNVYSTINGLRGSGRAGHRGSERPRRHMHTHTNTPGDTRAPPPSPRPIKCNGGGRRDDEPRRWGVIECVTPSRR